MRYWIVTAASLVALSSAAMAAEPVKKPVKMTDAQMDQVVAGAACNGVCVFDVANGLTVTAQVNAAVQALTSQSSNRATAAPISTAQNGTGQILGVTR